MTNEENLVRELLERAVQEFQSNAISAQVMRRFATDAPAIFSRVGIAMLLTATETVGFRYLAMLLVKQPTVFKQLCKPTLFTQPQAVMISRRLMGVDASIDIRLARQLPARNGNTVDTIEDQAAERALEILDEISPGNRIIPILSHLTRHSDIKISSKATLLIGKRMENIAFTRRLLMDETDPRIRANAIEAIWGNDSPPAQELFWEVLKDRQNRVVGNAMVGLYLAGEEKVNGIVTRFAQDRKAEFRMTSAWTMGRIGNADFLPTLSPLLKDEHPGVRSAALRSLQNIRQVEKQRRPSETDLAAELPLEESSPVALLEVPSFGMDLRLDGQTFSADKKGFRW